MPYKIKNGKIDGIPSKYTEVFMTVKDFVSLYKLRATEYDNLYVSSFGCVYTVVSYGDHCCYLIRKTQKQNSGYMIVKFNKKSKQPTQETVHRLVAKAFIPNPENKTDVNHKNGIKTDNRANNLEWTSRKENMQHFFHSPDAKNNPDWQKKLIRHHDAVVKNAILAGKYDRTKYKKSK